MASSWLLVIVVMIFGAVVGSFLNVVIHRLPRGMSIRHPPRSICPACGTGIRWYHNIPVASWLRLRGRCHDCGTPISVRYPLVESATALVFLFVWDQLLVGGSMARGADLAADWPLLVAYFGLFSALIASAVIDIESYTIDIRICIFAMILGVIAHGLRGLPIEPPFPPDYFTTRLLPPALCLIGGAMGLTWLLTFFIGTRFLRVSAAESDEMPPPSETTGHAHDIDGADDGSSAKQSSAVSGETGASDAVSEHPASPPTAGTAVGISLLLLLLLGITAWLIGAADRPAGLAVPPAGVRALLICAVMLFLLILAGLTPREVDHEVYTEIEENRPRARRVAMCELAWLLPAVVVGVGLFVWFRRTDLLGMSWPDALARLDSAPMIVAALGASLAAAAAMIWAAAIGWAVRIFGTLAFGKEAYGAGDIYIMAAIGAAAGIWNCLFGFFLAALLALVGTLVIMLRKRSRAIPFGPWLALGSLCVLPIEPTLLRFFQPAVDMIWSLLTGRLF